FCSTRTVQRQDFIRRYGIRDLHSLAWHSTLHEYLPLGMLEEIAKWFTHEEQRHFVDRLVELSAPLFPQNRDLKKDVEYFGPALGILLHVDGYALKRIARQVRREIEASWDSV